MLSNACRAAPGPASDAIPTMLSRSLVFALGLLLATAASAQGGKERLDRFLKDMRTLSADFTQQVFDENLRRIDDSQGTFVLSRPNRFRFEYFPPLPTLIVSDGQRVWIYDAELKQVTVRAIDKTIGSTPALLLSSDRPIDEDFAMRELGEVSGLVWVGLKPLAADATFTDIRLGFDDKTLRMMEMADNFGQVTQMRFVRIEENARVNEALFRFTPPAGVDVIYDDPSLAPAAVGN